MMLGVFVGALIGYFINTETSIQCGILIALILGEIRGLLYIELTSGFDSEVRTLKK